jgi:hypothetical protein
MRLIDLEKYDDVGVSLVFGRIFSYGITVVIFLFIQINFS